MSILIEGMEMPKHDDEYVIFTVYGDGGVVYGPLNRPHVRYKNRAAPVPEPHGDLIDASEKIRVQMYDDEHEDFHTEEMTIDDLLSQSWVKAYAFPVIPASGED